MDPLNAPSRPLPKPTAFTAELTGRRFLAPQVFELQLTRPDTLVFQAGQRIELKLEGITREYSLASSPAAETLRLCIGLVPQGRLTPRLAHVPLGRELDLAGPQGYFMFQPTTRPAVFIAGGTGIAPFRSMVAAGQLPDLLIQGAPTLGAAPYKTWFQPRLARHVCCLSQDPAHGDGSQDVFPGRVTDYLAHQLPKGVYDFYICGGPELVRDTMAVIDAEFPQSRVRTELFD